MAERLAEDIQASQPIPPSPEKGADAAAAEPVKVKKPATTVNSTMYVPTHAHKRLKEIAFTEDCKIHDLILEGIDRVFASRGHSERAGKRPV